MFKTDEGHGVGTSFTDANGVKVHFSGASYPTKAMMDDYWKRSMSAHAARFGSGSIDSFDTTSIEGHG